MISILALAFIAPAQSITTSANADRERSVRPGSPATELIFAAPVLLIATYQRYSSLRRGREQEIAAVVCMVPAKYQYCPDFGYPNPWERFAPVSFELNPQPGFTVGYRKGNDYRTQARGTPFESGDKQVVLFKLRAADDAPLGAHVLQGKMIFRRGDQGPGGVWSGNGMLEEVEVKVPIEVVGHDDVVVQAAAWPRKEGVGHRTARGTQDTLAALPTLAFEWLICQFGDCDRVVH
ncbi:MAG TPA: hypothetical protein VI685_05495 [Candidatus Angelobacter sp.]